MKNKAAVHLGKLAAAKRRKDMGEPAYRAYMKEIRNKPSKGVIPTTDSTNA